MKRILSCLLVGMVVACGNHNFSSERNRTSQRELDSATSGLQLSVKNSLPEETVGANRVRPHLNVYFCSPLPTGGDPTPRTEDRCVALVGIIENGTTEKFLVPKEKLAEVYQRGHGRGAFEFMDNHQGSSIPWHCYSPNDSVTLDSNFDTKQIWHVEVNQRHSFSYGCLVDRR